MPELLENRYIGVRMIRCWIVWGWVNAVRGVARGDGPSAVDDLVGASLEGELG
jgi:hypothetical protein